MQLAFVRFLVEECKAEVNQQDRELGWTPLHRCARLAHVTQPPYMEIFEYLLQKGADPSIRTFQTSEPPGGAADVGTAERGLQTVLDVCVEKGRGWRTGQVRSTLQVP